MEYQVSHSHVWLHWHAGPSFGCFGGHGKRVPTVIDASIGGLPSSMYCNAGTWLHPPALFQTGREEFVEERTN